MSTNSLPKKIEELVLRTLQETMEEYGWKIGKSKSKVVLVLQRDFRDCSCSVSLWELYSLGKFENPSYFSFQGVATFSVHRLEKAIRESVWQGVLRDDASFTCRFYLKDLLPDWAQSKGAVFEATPDLTNQCVEFCRELNAALTTFAESLNSGVAYTRYLSEEPRLHDDPIDWVTKKIYAADVLFRQPWSQVRVTALIEELKLRLLKVRSGMQNMGHDTSKIDKQNAEKIEKLLTLIGASQSKSEA